MAKYVLNCAKPTTAIDCRILDENYIANTYTVRFKNGVIKDVDKRRVRELNHLDEAVLDRLKKFGLKLWDNIVKVGNYIYFSIKGRKINVVSPINTMAAAQSVEGLSFYPSETLAEIAEDAGITPTVTEDSADSGEDLDFINDANKFWEIAIQKYNDDKASSNESLRRNYRKSRRMYEATNDIKLEHDSFRNVSTDELREMLLESFQNVQDGANKSSETAIAPYCIWGAPGIGKTQIVKGLIRDLRDAGMDVNIISINAVAMRKDDFSLPGTKGQKIRITTKDGVSHEIDSRQAAELPKEWLPVYDPNDIDPEKGITEEMLDNHANGGTDEVEGVGGFFFIDELSRISPDVNNVIMTLVQGREFNGLKIGSKWMFVCAANRSTDLTGFGASHFSWDAAQAGRFSHVNFVPTFEEWAKWAREPIAGTATPHILPEIVDFLTEHKNLWYSYASRNTENEKSKEGSLLYPNPRGWEQISTEVRGANTARAKWKNNAGSPIASVLKKSGNTNLSDMTSGDQAEVFRQYVGNKAADAYKTWAMFDKEFTDKTVKEVWTIGDEAPVTFDINPNTLERVITKIFRNNPNSEEYNPAYRMETSGYVNTLKNTKYRKAITEEQISNIIDYIIKCIRTGDEQGKIGGQMIGIVFNKIVNILKEAPYYLKPLAEFNKIKAELPNTEVSLKSAEQEPNNSSKIEYYKRCLSDLTKLVDTYYNHDINIYKILNTKINEFNKNIKKNMANI